jgi:hypothetical protein
MTFENEGTAISRNVKNHPMTQHHSPDNLIHSATLNNTTSELMHSKWNLSRREKTNTCGLSSGCMYIFLALPLHVRQRDLELGDVRAIHVGQHFVFSVPCMKFRWLDDHIILINLVMVVKYAFNDHSPIYNLLLCSLIHLPATIHNLQIHKESFWNICNSSHTHFKNLCSIKDDSIYSTELLKNHESKCNHESLLSFSSPECFQQWQSLGSCFINCCL